MQQPAKHRYVDYLSPQELAKVKNLGTVDVAAVRLWLDKREHAGSASTAMARVKLLIMIFVRSCCTACLDTSWLQLLH